VRAITVKQPWAWAIATGAKTVENRGRPHPWTSAIGVRIAIHAGKGWDATALNGRALIDLALAVEGQRPEHVANGGVPYAAALPYLLPNCHHQGAVMATALLADVHAGTPGCGCDPVWAAPDQWHLILRDIAPVKPVPCRGALGLWPLPADVLQLVRPQEAP